MTKVQTLAAAPVGNIFCSQIRFRPLSELSMPFYEATIIFHNMEFVLEKDEAHPITVELEPGKITYMNRPRKNKVRKKRLILFISFRHTLASKSGILAQLVRAPR